MSGRLWAVLAWLPMQLAVAGAGLPEQIAHWLDGATLQATGLDVQVQPWVEDGAFVAISVSLQGAEPPVRLALLRSAEADPRIAQLTLNRWQPPLRLTTRVRLPVSQAVIVLARDSRDRVWQARRHVRVLASSCQAQAQDNGLTGLGEIQASWRAGVLTSLLRHPMETGRRLDAAGQVLPRRLLQRFEVHSANGVVLRVEPFEGLAANPYWRLQLPGDLGPLQLRWEDADGSLYQKRLR